MHSLLEETLTASECEESESEDDVPHGNGDSLYVFIFFLWFQTHILVTKVEIETKQQIGPSS
jgi:hypothetical protein